MRQTKAFTLYYLLPFAIYVLFAALQTPSKMAFWGLIAIGVFFALVGLFLLQNALVAVQPRVENVEPPAPPVPPAKDETDSLLFLKRERELEERLAAQAEEINLLRAQNSTLTSEAELHAGEIKKREETIQELRFELRSLLAVSRGKSSPAAS